MRAALGSIERLETGRYRISIEGPPKPDGRRTRKSKIVRSTREDAEIALARMKLDAGKPVDIDLTVERYWEVFYSPTLSRLAPTTRQGYMQAWRTLVKPLFGDSPMGALKARDIERRLLTIEKPGQQRNAFKLLRQMFNEAYRDELVEANPFDRRIRLSKMEKHEPEVILLEDIPKWVEAARGQPWEPIAICMLFSGMRREEACALYWEDVELTGGLCSIRIDKTLTESAGKVHEGPTKTPESRRTVFMSGWPARRLAELKSTGPLWPDANGNRMAPDKVSREYKKALSRSDAKYVPLRNLRNSYATMMLGLGTSDSMISKSLGHTTLVTDYAHYFAANMPAHIANAALFGEAVGSAVNGTDAE